MNKERMHQVLFALIILVGIYLRFHNLYYNTIFNWDQENSVAYKAREIILDHHLSLIGARTGVGDLYLGPLYNYTSAFFYFLLQGNPIAGAVEAGTFSILTALFGYFLTRRIIGSKTALFFLVFYLISPFILSLDRIPWNVNIFPISSLLVIYGLLSLTKSKDKVGFLMLGLGLFLGFNSHFSVIFLIVSSMIFLAVRNKIMDKKIIWSLLGLLIGVLPLFVFNLRHGSILSSNTGEFISENITQLSLLPERSVKIFFIMTNIFGKLFFPEADTLLSLFIGLVFISSAIKLLDRNKYKDLFLIFLIFFLTYLLGMSFYSGDIPEYYFSGLFPLFVIIFAVITTEVRIISGINNLMVLFSFLILFKSYSLVEEKNLQSLGNKIDIVKEIKRNSNGKVKVVYDMDLGWNYGYQYLFDYYYIPIDNDEQKNIFTISYPLIRAPLPPDYQSGGIALSFPGTTRKIYLTKQVEFYDSLFRMRLPREWVTLRCPGVDFDKYLLSPDIKLSCATKTDKLFILVENISNCNLREMDSIVTLKINPRIPVYLIPPDNLPAISVERNRCIKFIESTQVKGQKISSEILELLISLRK